MARRRRARRSWAGRCVTSARGLPRRAARPSAQLGAVWVPRVLCDGVSVSRLVLLPPCVQFMSHRRGIGRCGTLAQAVLFRSNGGVQWISRCTLRFTVALGLAILTMLVALLVIGTPALMKGASRIAELDVNQVAQRTGSQPSPTEQLEALDGIRGRMIQLAAAIGAIGTLALTGLSYRLSVKSHVTDRFGQAVAQLHASTAAEQNGGIHELVLRVRRGTGFRLGKMAIDKELCCYCAFVTRRRRTGAGPDFQMLTMPVAKCSDSVVSSSSSAARRSEPGDPPCQIVPKPNSSMVLAMAGSRSFTPRQTPTAGRDGYSRSCSFSPILRSRSSAPARGRSSPAHPFTQARGCEFDRRPSRPNLRYDGAQPTESPPEAAGSTSPPKRSQ